MHPEWSSILRHRVGLSGVGGFILGVSQEGGCVDRGLREEEDGQDQGEGH